MKLKEKKELFSKTAQELQQVLKEVRVELFQNKLLHAQRKLKNTSVLHEARKKQAQILTILREKQLSAELLGETTQTKSGGAK